MGRPKGKGKSKLDPYKDEIISLLKNGSTKAHIAKTFHTSLPNLHHWLEITGNTQFIDKGRGKNKLKHLGKSKLDQHEDEIISLLESGSMKTSIAKKFHTSLDNFYNWLAKSGHTRFIDKENRGYYARKKYLKKHKLKYLRQE